MNIPGAVLRWPSITCRPWRSWWRKFESLPGIGHKSAQRLAYHVLGMTQEEAQSFAQAILDAHEKIHTCKVCCNLTDDELCPVCRSGSRDKSTICVVEEPKDVFALERAGEYNGLYHVLHGAISPLSGIGPDQLRIKELLARMDPSVGEVHHGHQPHRGGRSHRHVPFPAVKAPGGQGDAAWAYGIPVGGDLEYADEVTLQRAMEGRQEL